MLANYLSTTIIGIMIALGAPKIAASILSGQPAMGAGDIARVAHGAAHIGHMAAHTAQTGAKAAGAAAHAGQGAVRGGIGAWSSLDAAGNAAKRARAGVMEDMASGASGASMAGANRAGAAAFFKSVGSSLGQHFSDRRLRPLPARKETIWMRRARRKDI